MLNSSSSKVVDCGDNLKSLSHLEAITQHSTWPVRISSKLLNKLSGWKLHSWF